MERVIEGDLITKPVGGHVTFATPVMIGLMEWARHKALDGLQGDKLRRLRHP